MINSNNQTLTERTEELFLKIFKVVILVVMGLSLILAVGLSIYSASLYFQTPKKPEPEKAAPAEEVNIDKLLKQLQQEEAPKKEEAPKQEEKQAPQALKYLEDVTAIYRCTVVFAKAVGAQVDETDAIAASRTTEEYRSQIEKLADSNDLRGPAYIKDVVKFTCATLKNKEVIALRKENKVSGVFLKILNFHFREWDRIQQDKVKFERKEAIRIAKEEAKENERVSGAKIQAVLMITAAGIAFSVFMAIALYLIFAKIETNLRRIASAGHTLSPNAGLNANEIAS